MPDTLKPPAIDPADLPHTFQADYPAPFIDQVRGQLRCALGRALGLTAFGVNMVILPPGCWSSQRHWHSHEEEFVMLLEGQVTLVTDAGEQVLRAGQVAGFPRGRADGHHFINRSDATARLLVVGDDIAADVCSYPDIDLHLPGKSEGFTDKAGKPL